MMNSISSHLKSETELPVKDMRAIRLRGYTFWRIFNRSHSHSGMSRQKNTKMA